ncbi:MAG: hypothetical protein ACTSRP_17530 [Candidatus Helarchaeota archaeon]
MKRLIIVLFLIFIITIILLNCSKKKREWDNPYDPESDNYSSQTIGGGEIVVSTNYIYSTNYINTTNTIITTNVIITTNIIYYSDGVISSDTTWDQDVILNVPIVVLSGATLTINEGVNVKIALSEDEIYLSVYGGLVANSTVKTGISFSYLSGQYGSKYNGIRIYGGASIQMKNGKIDSCIYIMSASQQTNIVSNINFISNKIRRSSTDAVCIWLKNIVIQNSKFIENDGYNALRLIAKDGSIINNGTKIINCDIIGNQQLPLYDIAILSNNYIADNNGYSGVTLSTATPDDSNVPHQYEGAISVISPRNTPNF